MTSPPALLAAVLATVLAAVFVAPPETAAASPDDDRPLRIYAALQADRFARDRSDWYAGALGGYYESGWGTAGLEYRRSRRFDHWDDLVTADLYPALWDGAYANLRVQIAPEARVHPEADVLVELFQVLGDGWEPALQYRQMRYEEQTVHLAGAALARYVGAWYLRGQLVGADVDERVNLYFSAAARRYLDGPDTYVDLRFIRGEQVVTIGSGPSFDVGTTWSVVVLAQTYVTPAVGLSASLAYTDESVLPPHTALALRLLTRW